MKTLILTLLTLTSNLATASVYCRDLSTPDEAAALSYTKYEDAKVGTRSVVLTSLLSKDPVYGTFTTLNESISFGSISYLNGFTKDIMIFLPGQTLNLVDQKNDFYEQSIIASIISDYPPFTTVTEVTTLGCTTDLNKIDQLKIKKQIIP